MRIHAMSAPPDRSGALRKAVIYLYFQPLFGL
jgi:hypothetical protein